MALVCIGVGLLAPDAAVRMIAMVAGATLAVLAVIIRCFVWYGTSQMRGIDKRLGALIGLDAAPCFTTDDIGQIGYQNSAAYGRAV